MQANPTLKHRLTIGFNIRLAQEYVNLCGICYSSKLGQHAIVLMLVKINSIPLYRVKFYSMGTGLARN